MKINKLPPLDYLKQCFTIDETLACGLRWINERPKSHFSTQKGCTTWSSHYAGKPSGSILGNGYYYSRLSKSRYPNHRIIYAIHNNTIDFNDKLIDHIDGNKHNNKPSNLRLVTNAQNQYNSNKQKNNTSGHKNISFCKKNKKYRCAMRFEGKDVYIGLFNSLEEAITARDLKFKQLAGHFYRS